MLINLLFPQSNLTLLQSNLINPHVRDYLREWKYKNENIKGQKSDQTSAICYQFTTLAVITGT